MSFSNYPDALDNSTTLPPSTDLVTPVKAEVTNRLRDAILAIEGELGIQPSSTFSTVRARLDNLRQEVENIKSTLGSDPSGSFDTVEARLDDVDASLTALSTTVSNNAGRVGISSADTTIDFLENKISAGANVTITKLNTGGDEILQISASGGGGGGSGTVFVSATDTTDGFLEDKIVVDGSSNITLTKQNIGANENLLLTLGSHAATHSDGGSDEITVQNLGSGGAAANAFLTADGSGGLSFVSNPAPTAHATSHEQGGSDELTAQNLGSGSAPDGYVMVADGLGGWNVEEQSGGGSGTGVVITPLIAGSQNTGSTSPTGVGACTLNPNDLGFPSATFTLEVILQVTDASFDGYFELFNVTDGYAVVHSDISTTSLTPELLTDVLTISAGNFLDPTQDNLLEGRIYLASGAGAGDRVICKYAVIRSRPV